MAETKRMVLLPLADPIHLARGTVEFLIRDPSTDPGLLQRIARHYLQDASVLNELVKHQSLSDETVRLLLQGAPREIRARLQVDLNTTLLAVRAESDRQGMPDGAKGVQSTATGEDTLYRTVQNMSVAEKVRFAMRADKTGRALLMKDPNKMVALAVLGSPKITEQEVESIAQSRNVSDEILRTIAKNKEWVSQYGIMHALVNNPKTPAGIAVSFLPYLKRKDVAMLAKSRAVSEVVRAAAGKLTRGRART